MDLPNLTEREAILTLHLVNRGRDATAFDISHLAEAAHGFSGAGDRAGRSCRRSTRPSRRRRPWTPTGLLAEIRSTRPLSVTRREDLTTLRAWAEGRAVPASGTPHA